MVAIERLNMEDGDSRIKLIRNKKNIDSLFLLPIGIENLVANLYIFLQIKKEIIEKSTIFNTY